LCNLVAVCSLIELLYANTTRWLGYIGYIHKNNLIKVEIYWAKKKNENNQQMNIAKINLL